MPIKIFLVYAPNDEDLRCKLEIHMKPLQRSKLAEIWDQSKIAAGQNREEEIEIHRSQADIILLLLSPNSLNSPFYQEELVPALELRSKGKKQIIPIILRHAAWENDELLKGLQVLPYNKKPITDWQNLDKAYAHIVQILEQIVTNIIDERKSIINGNSENNAELETAPINAEEPDLIGLIQINPWRIGQREKTVKDIYAQLTQRGISTLILTGMDGTGKSTLAALVYAYVRQQQSDQESFFKAPPVWISITPTLQMKTLAARLYENLHLTPPQFTSDFPKQQAVTLFRALNDVRNPPLLIVLDQFDYLLNSQTRRILDDHPGFLEWLVALNDRECRSRILITSRHLPYLPNNFTFSSIQQYPLGDIDIAEGMDILRKRGIDLAEADVHKVIHHCGGSAYALARLPAVDVQNILRDPERFQSWKFSIARGLVSPNYQELDVFSRKLLRSFAIYREPVLAKAARIVLQRSTQFTTDQFQETLEGLVAQSYLRDSGELYQVQTVIQTYLQGMPDPEFNVQMAHERAAHYYLQQADSPFSGKAWARDLRDERYLIEAVWHFCQARRWSAAYRHLFEHGLYERLKLRGENATLLSLISSFIPTEKWHPKRDFAANIYSSLGTCYTLLGRKTDALASFKNALDIAEALGDVSQQGVLKREIGRVYNALGNKKIALSFFQEALQILHDRGKQLDIAETYVRLGRVYSVTGQQEQAREVYKQALKIYRIEHNASGEGVTLSYLGRVYSALGEPSRGLDLCGQGVEILQRVGDRRGEDRALDNLGYIYSVLGQYHDAKIAYEKALEIAQAIGDRGGEGIICHGLATAYMGMGEREKAQNKYKEALETLIEVGDEWREGIVRGSLAEFYATAGDKSNALAYYQQAINIQDKHENSYEKGKTLYSFGLFYLKQPEAETRHKADEIALASFLAACQFLAGEPSSHAELVKVQREIEKLQQRLGEETMVDLQARIGDQPLRIVMRKLAIL